ncbi:MAG: acyl-CoA thioesterase [Bacteroidota bacterium]|uniref:Acyl CoA thioester hydrolase family protein n=1 Tax=Christiangramia flava JLT2011 TaxID=1229726 RepID=A0A1L7I900_9FLAO|nr:acyl-CoA thioesterase [Christiangramia flava]APU69683.1 Acyl CoA thioester hydrolase family protein [Christiangramia flava JLT2011]MEE2772113.1 acyl-CoA thioesterase [Bacteroidota bacterium]OSS39286.1 acyl-CoA thioester hydrolase [Christiangramia flava JLT2011]
MNDFKTVKESQVVISELMLPSHSNFNGKIHGGYILSLLDQIAFACASKHSGKYCVTASVDTVDFLKPIEIGELVTMRASVNFVGHSSMVIGIRVEAENIQTGQRKHCNSSYFTMVAKDQEGKSVNVPGLILQSENEIRRFAKSIKRKDMKKKRSKEFHETDFSSHEYHDILEEYKVQIRKNS